MGKVVSIRLSDEDARVWAEFQAYVALSKGHVRGNLSKEVVNALREYLERRRQGSQAGSQAAPPPTPPASTSREEKKVEPMTERQREYIKSLLKKVAAKLGKGYEALAEEVARELGFDPREGLTKDQASKVIEWLESRLE
ncbi:MAG: hypothetical protein QXM08_04060 [Thermofilaceae archaeon]